MSGLSPSAPSVTVQAPASAAVGEFISVAGTVIPEADVVQLQLSKQNLTLPTGAWFSAQTTNTNFTGFVMPVSPGIYYVWAYDPVTGASAVSDAISVAAAGVSFVPVPTAIVAALLGGVAGGETPDELPAATTVLPSDIALVSQGNKVILAQSFANIWAWVETNIPSYMRPQVTISNGTVVDLDDSAHNGRVLVIAAEGVTIQPNAGSLGAGFVCDVINTSASSVSLSGIITDTGALVIASNGIARIFAVGESGGGISVYGKL